jgi:hypothetical protein
MTLRIGRARVLVYDSMVSDEPASPRPPGGADLLDILTRLRLQPADATSAAAAARGQLEIVVARIAALTDALRAGGGDADARLASRLLLADVGQVVAQLRGEANELAAALDRALEALRSAAQPTGTPTE